MTFEDDLLHKLAEIEQQIKDLKYECALDRQRITKLEISNPEMLQTLKKILYEQAIDRQRIAKLELYIETKNNGHRRDFNFLAVDLKKEVLRRGKQGMDYKDILSFFRFRHNMEAFRLMDFTAQLFHEEVRLTSPKSHKQRKKVVPFNL